MQRARGWVIWCGSDQWGSRLMEQLARTRFEVDPSLDFVTVYEHAGWSLSWNRQGDVVGTANDMAVLSDGACHWLKAFPHRDLVGQTRDGVDTKFPGYFPKLAEVA